MLKKITIVIGILAVMVCAVYLKLANSAEATYHWSGWSSCSTRQGHQGLWRWRQCNFGGSGDGCGWWESGDKPWPQCQPTPTPIPPTATPVQPTPTPVPPTPTPVPPTPTPIVCDDGYELVEDQCQPVPTPTPEP